MHYHGHRQRLREKLSKNPVEMPDYEILELLLSRVLTRKDTKPLAKELLRRFQTLKGVMDAKPAELLSLDGFGPKLLEFWGLLRELMARYAESPLRVHERLASATEVAAMARTRLAGTPHEEVWIAFVDSQIRLLAWERLCKGTIDNSVIHTREVLERALLLKAHGFILVHNHPGGNTTPSGADLNMTSTLLEAARKVDLRFLDHVIVTDDSWCSLMRDQLL